MNKLTLLLGTLLILIFSIASCSTDPEGYSDQNTEIDMSDSAIKSDARKLVDLQCKVMKLIGEAKTGDTEALMKSERINQEAEKVARALKEKYTTEVTREKFAKAYEEALGDCELVEIRQ